MSRVNYVLVGIYPKSGNGKSMYGKERANKLNFLDILNRLLPARLSAAAQSTQWNCCTVTAATNLF